MGGKGATTMEREVRSDGPVAIEREGGSGGNGEGGRERQWRAEGQSDWRVGEGCAWLPVPLWPLAMAYRWFGQRRVGPATPAGAGTRFFSRSHSPYHRSGVPMHGQSEGVEGRAKPKGQSSHRRKGEAEAKSEETRETDEDR